MNNGGFEFVVILKNDACKLEKLAFHRQSCYTMGHTLNIITVYTYLYCKQWKAWLDLGMELHQILIALFQAPCPASMSELTEQAMLASFSRLPIIQFLITFSFSIFAHCKCLKKTEQW